MQTKISEIVIKLIVVTSMFAYKKSLWNKWINKIYTYQLKVKYILVSSLCENQRHSKTMKVLCLVPLLKPQYPTPIGKSLYQRHLY